MSEAEPSHYRRDRAVHLREVGVVDVQAESRCSTTTPFTEPVATRSAKAATDINTTPARTPALGAVTWIESEGPSAEKELDRPTGYATQRWHIVSFEHAAERADEAAGIAAIAKAHLDEDRGHRLLAESVELLAQSVAALARAQTPNS